MRTLSLMIIAVCFALMGRNIADSYKKRVSMLEKTEAMITLIRDEIDFCALPINEMIHLISQKESLKQLAFIEECYRFLSSGLDFPHAWNNSLEDRKNIAFLNIFEYTKCNRVARSSLNIGDQAEFCTQLFYFKGEFLWI